MSDVLKNTTCKGESNEIPKSIYGTAEVRSELNRLSDDSFLTILDLPRCLKEYNRIVCGQEEAVSLDSLELNIRTIDLPEISIPSDRVQYRNGSVVESSQKLDDFPSITIQFKLSDRLYNYHTIYRWLNMVVDIEKGVSSDYCRKDYETTYTIILIDQYKCPIGSFNFHGVIPETLGGFNLNKISNGEQIFIDFTFAYDYFTFELNPNLAMG